MFLAFLLPALIGCQTQYLVIPDAQVIEGTPQYAYSNVWVGAVTPTYALTEGSLDLEPDGSPATIEVDFSGPFDFGVTEILFMGLNTGDTEFGAHWKYELDASEIAAKKVVVHMYSVTKKPAKAGCSTKHLGTWVCFQGAKLGVTGLGLSAAGEDSVSIPAEVPLTLPPLVQTGGSGPSGTCDAYTIDDCCGGSSGISAVECAWDPSCECPAGTSDLGFSGDGLRRCGCPG
jgi:hypothetical protein